MKIRTQFVITMLLFCIVLVVVFALTIITQHELERLDEQRELAHSVERGATDLSYLWSAYLLYQEGQQRARWNSEYSSISTNLSRLTPKGPEQQALVENIKANLQRVKAVFADVISGLERVPHNHGAGMIPASMQVSWSRMTVQNRAVFFDALQLSQMLQDERDQLTRKTNNLIFALIGLFVIFLLSDYFLVYRRALRSISELQAGTRIIGAGNLEYTLNPKHNDEIGELSHAFNRMTASLKDVTASKAAFEKEVGERKEAEERIKASLREKEVLLKEIHHRVKNNLQVISSLVSLQVNELADPTQSAMFWDIHDRVQSMALVHEKLYESANLAQVQFADYVQSLLAYLWRAHGAAAANIQLKLEMESVALSVERAVPCGLILNELAGNALKHAFRGGAAGEVSVALNTGPDGRVRLRVCDNGVGLPLGLDWRQSRSLGLRLVQMLAAQLNGSVDVQSGAGTEIEVTFHASAEREEEFAQTQTYGEERT